MSRDDTEPMPEPVAPEPPQTPKRSQSRMFGLLSLGLFLVVAIAAVVIWQWDNDDSPQRATATTLAGADDDGNAEDRETPSSDASGSLRITSENGTAALDGTVSSQTEADTIAEAAQRAFGGVSGDLTVDESLDPAPWVDALPELLRDLAAANDAGVEVEGNRLRITGAVPTDAERVDLANLAGSLFPQLRIDNALAVASGGGDGDGTATFLLTENPDGTVTLRGDIPSGAITERLLARAGSIYGADNLIDEMVITGSAEPEWMRSMTRIIRDLRRVENAEVDAGYTEENTLILSGTVRNERDRERVVGRFAETMPDFTVDDRLEVGSSNS